jgi:hypothetical protein
MEGTIITTGGENSQEGKTKTVPFSHITFVSQTWCKTLPDTRTPNNKSGLNGGNANDKANNQVLSNVSNDFQTPACMHTVRETAHSTPHLVRVHHRGDGRASVAARLAQRATDHGAIRRVRPLAAMGGDEEVDEQSNTTIFRENFRG